MTKDQLREMFRVIDASAWGELGRFFHPEIVYDRPGFDPLEGREAIMNFYENVRTIRGEHRFEAMVVDGAHGASWGRFLGGAADGTALDIQFADCYGFEDGMMRRRKSYFYVPLV